jgi:hypothetical protein
VSKPNPTLIVLAAIALASCSSKPEPAQSTAETAPVVKLDKPFAAAGNIEMQLDGGDYTIKASADEHVRVSFAGNKGDAIAALDASGERAKLTIRDTPHNNFRAVVEVPATSDLTVHLSGGNLDVAAITGNKDIDSKAGNVVIATPNANDYGAVDAAVKVGDLSAGPFGESGSGLAPHLKWSGPGKYTLRANLGAGNLQLKH